VKNKMLVILCLNLLAVPQTALGQSAAGGQGESEEDLSGAWLVSVHLTTTDGRGSVFFSNTETHDYKATITFVPATTEHYTASGQVNGAPKTDEERVYNVYFESCARGEHDIAKTSPHKYQCSYEYGEANRYENGTTTTTVYKGDLTFELNSRVLRGRTKFSVDFKRNGSTTATYSEEAEWTGKRQADAEHCAAAQESVDLPRSRLEADQDKMHGLNTGATADEPNSFASVDDEERHHILIPDHDGQRGNESSSSWSGEL
jgi:hypothetical protein